MNSQKVEKKDLKTLITNYNQNVGLQTLANAVPYFGPLIDRTLNALASRYYEKRFRLLIQELRNDIEEIKSQTINLEYLNSEEFYYFFQKVSEKAIREIQEGKIRILAKTLKICADPQIKFEEKDKLTEVAIDLTELDVLILKEIIQRDSNFTQIDRHENKDRIPYDTLRTSFSDISPNLIILHLQKLNKWGLIRDWGVGRWGYGGPGDWTPTEVGREFLNYLDRA